ncbi:MULTISPECIES: SDR family oxidoreductase [Prosthecochloris]|uniref:SDR family oxidoreductase n=1 Tax=Prosthecochloris vibrioformis TaxID=1098 RepID=A0A5C4RZF2_PROVB|nr:MULTISPECIES: SDR family oxidoreductase [Prosthecochloris]ANT64091.1 hypothetical protein Ptc2401_00289 [Prosthecochloris sp. CIB 2401]TNJ36372.1 SDR family oxidoreductase [Prosthecochloris vibrioformis]
MTTTVSLLGCGWLGLPLGRELLEQGYRVKGSVTSNSAFPELQEAGIVPFRIMLSPELEGDDPDMFFDTDILILNFPPERRPDIVDYHTAQFRSLVAALQGTPVRHVLMVSSTSVYPALQRAVREEDAHNPEALSGQALLGAEGILKGAQGFDTTILRFCGLIGYDRRPERFLMRSGSFADGSQPLNLIHRDDCIGIISEVLRQGAWGEVFNACAPLHPLRREYYTKAAERSGLPLPQETGQNESPKPFKIIDSTRLEEKLGYRFTVPDPLDLPR